VSESPETPETTFDDAAAPAAAEPVAEVVDAEPVPEEPEQDEEAPASDDAAQAADYLALAQRTQADFENYRKRVARDAAAALDRGVRRLAEELFPALDHLDAALQAIGDPEVVKGVRLVQDEFIAALRRVGIEPFSPEGEAFDPNEHEAMAQQPAEGVEAGQVISVYQQGYRHNGHVLRPARVVVAA
jgi:molecular chaperone GrpE